MLPRSQRRAGLSPAHGLLPFLLSEQPPGGFTVDSGKIFLLVEGWQALASPRHGSLQGSTEMPHRPTPLASLPAALRVSPCPRAASEPAGLPADGSVPLLWLFAYGILIRPIIFRRRQLRFICFAIRQGLVGDILMPAMF